MGQPAQNNQIERAIAEAQERLAKGGTAKARSQDVLLAGFGWMAGVVNKVARESQATVHGCAMRQQERHEDFEAWRKTLHNSPKNGARKYLNQDTAKLGFYVTVGAGILLLALERLLG